MTELKVCASTLLVSGALGQEVTYRYMGALGTLGGLTVLMALALLFLGPGMRRGSLRTGGTSISGPIFFVLLVMGILMILGDITWPFF